MCWASVLAKAAARTLAGKRIQVAVTVSGPGLRPVTKTAVVRILR